MDKPFNEKEGLGLIESMINRARNNFSESGTLYLLWGSVVFVCSLVQFIAWHFFQTPAFYIWFLTWLLVIYQLVFLRKKARQRKVRTYSDDILKYVWLCFVFCMLVMIFVLIQQKSYASINPAILVLYAMPTFLSGFILRFRPLIVGGICCWILAIGSIFVPFNFQGLFICAAVLLAWILPGILLRKKYLNDIN